MSKSHQDNGAVKCLRPECDKLGYARGLCRRCYLTARRLIHDKQTTWDKLIKEGKAFHRKSRQTNEVTQWLLNKS